MIKKITTTILVGLLLGGCGTTSLQSQVKLTRDVAVSQQVGNKNMFLNVTGLSGSGFEKTNLKNTLIEKLSQKGYKIVSSGSAAYRLDVKVLFINNLKEAGNIKNGIGQGINGGMGARASGTDSLIAGVTIALAGKVIGKAMEDSVYRAVVELKITNIKNPQNIQTSRVLGEVKKMGLKPEEAMPILEDKVASKIADIF